MHSRLGDREDIELYRRQVGGAIYTAYAFGIVDGLQTAFQGLAQGLPWSANARLAGGLRDDGEETGLTGTGCWRRLDCQYPYP